MTSAARSIEWTYNPSDRELFRSLRSRITSDPGGSYVKRQFSLCMVDTPGVSLTM